MSLEYSLKRLVLLMREDKNLWEMEMIRLGNSLSDYSEE